MSSRGDPNLRARRLSNFLTRTQQLETDRKHGVRRVKNRRAKGGLLESRLASLINGVPRCEAYQCGGTNDGGTDVVSLLFGLRYRWQCKSNSHEWKRLYQLLEECGVECLAVKDNGKEPLVIIPMRMWIDHLEFINVHPPKITDYP